MGLIKKVFDKKSPYLFFIKFLLCFCILYLFFPFYWGLTGKGGTLYSAFLDDHFNIIKQLTVFLTGAAKWLLTSLNYTVYKPNYHTLLIGNFGGVSLNPDCLGWAVMSFWVAFVYANSGSFIHKFKWMLIGLISISLINIIRIALIAVATHLRWKTLTSLDHHQTFNVFSYGCIFIIMYWYIKIQKKQETFDLARKQSNPVITV